VKVEFINKIWVKGTGKVSVLRKVLFVCAVILLLISLVQFLLGGLDEISWFTGVILPVVMLIYYRLNYNTDGYMGVRCDFRIEKEGFHVYYYDIDYRDGNGAHVEHIYIPYECVKELQYSRELVSVRIISQPVVTIHIKEKEEVIPVYENKEGVATREKVQGPEISGSSFYRLFYATGGILACLAVLVIGGLAMQVQEKNRLKQLLNEQVQYASAVQQVYVAEEGETIASICIKFYQTEEYADDIRVLNGLEEDEEPVAGQKLFLP